MVKYLSFKESIKKCYVILQEMRKFSMEIIKLIYVLQKRTLPSIVIEFRFLILQSQHIYTLQSIYFSVKVTQIL